jgi:hypothetical protein
MSRATILTGAQYRDRCRHFRGIQYSTCLAGVRYDSVRDTSAHPYRLPCLDVGYGEPATVCALRDLLMQEEHTANERALRAAADMMMSAIAAGKCYVCGKSAEPSRIVGRCRYAACGHRVGQVMGEEE